MSKRLIIYTSARLGSVSSAVLDKLATANDEKFKVWEWDLLKDYQKATELRYSNPMSDDQKALYGKIMKHKEYLDSFSEIVIGTAMHNFGVNVNTKTYFDILSQYGIAFSYENGKARGLFKPETKWTVICSGGGHYLDGPDDHVFPWFKSAFKFIGITNSEFFGVKGTLYPNFDLSKVEIPPKN